VKLEDLPAIWSEQAEEAVIGAMLNEPETVVDMASDRLTSADFFRPSHGVIFDALVDMRHIGIAVDLSTIYTYMDDRRLLDAIGGPSVLGEMAAGTFATLAAAQHIEEVRGKSLLRRLQGACCRVIASAQDAPHQVEEVLGSAETEIQRVVDAHMGAQRDQSVKSARQCAMDFVENAEKLHGKKNTYNGIPSGFYQLDLLLKGFQAGEYIAIAAAPGLGKTALALNLALNMASKRKCPETGTDLRPGYRVGFFSIEMNHLQLTNRMISMIAQMPSGTVRTPQAWTNHDFDRMAIAAENFATLPIHIDADGFMTPEKFRSRARWMKKSKDVEILFVDYLQLFNLSGKAQGDYDLEVTRQASEAIRQTAKELGIPIVVLLQFNKDGIRSGRPSMADIKGSGKIVQDAHNILIMHEVADEEPQNGVMPIQLTIAKARESERGTYRQYDYHGAIYTFKERQSHTTSGREAYHG